MDNQLPLLNLRHAQHNMDGTRFVAVSSSEMFAIPPSGIMFLNRL